MADTRAIRFGDRWTCQVCSHVTAGEWAMWRHLAEQHPTAGPGQGLLAALVEAVDRGELGRPPAHDRLDEMARRLHDGLAHSGVSLDEAAAAFGILRPSRRQQGEQDG